MPASKLENLLKSSKNGDLGAVVKRARSMGALTEALTAALPEADRGAIVAANVRDDGELVVICASPAWAAKLRFVSDVLLEAAQAAGADVTRCRVQTSAG